MALKSKFPKCVKLTNTVIGDLTFSDTISDTVIDGLKVRKTSRKGNVSFLLETKRNGKTVKRVIGSYPTMSIAQARKAASCLLIELGMKSEVLTWTCKHCGTIFGSQGLSDPTLRNVFEVYAEEYLDRKARSAKWQRAMFERYFGSIADRSVSSFTPVEIQRWHHELGSKHGEPTANRCLQLIKATINYGIRWGMVAGLNPTRAVKRFKEHSRERSVTDQEMPLLLEAIRTHATPRTRDIFFLCILTGQRVANVCSMAWRDLDLSEGMWRIPSDEFKTGVSHTVPLLPEAVALLIERKEATPEHMKDNAVHVFPARQNGGHVRFCNKIWEKVRNAAGLSDLTIHDLRRTHATLLLKNGASLAIVAQALGHKDFQRVTACYARRDYDAVRKATASGLERVAKMISTKSKSN